MVGRPHIGIRAELLPMDPPRGAEVEGTQSLIQTADSLNSHSPSVTCVDESLCDTTRSGHLTQCLYTTDLPRIISSLSSLDRKKVLPLRASAATKP